MAPDMLLGFDEARGESKTVFGVLDRVTGELTPIHYSDKPVTFEEIESVRDRLVNMSVPMSASWSAEIKLTHKEARHMKKNLRAMLGKKPRLPRKKKKAFKKWAVKQAQSHVRVWSSLECPNAQPLIDFYEKKLLEAASGKLQEDIYRHMGASGNTIKEIIKPLH